MNGGPQQYDSDGRPVAERPPGVEPLGEQMPPPDGEPGDRRPSREVQDDQRRVSKVQSDGPRGPGVTTFDHSPIQVPLHTDSDSTEVGDDQPKGDSQRQPGSTSQRHYDGNGGHRSWAGLRHTRTAGRHASQMEKLEHGTDLEPGHGITEQPPGQSPCHQRPRNHELPHRGRVQSQHASENREQQGQRSAK